MPVTTRSGRSTSQMRRWRITTQNTIHMDPQELYAELVHDLNNWTATPQLSVPIYQIQDREHCRISFWCWHNSRESARELVSELIDRLMEDHPTVFRHSTVGRAELDE